MDIGTEQTKNSLSWGLGTARLPPCIAWSGILKNMRMTVPAPWLHFEGRHVHSSNNLLLALPLWNAVNLCSSFLKLSTSSKHNSKFLTNFKAPCWKYYALPHLLIMYRQPETSQGEIISSSENIASLLRILCEISLQKLNSLSFCTRNSTWKWKHKCRKGFRESQGNRMKGTEETSFQNQNCNSSSERDDWRPHL